MLKPQKSKQHGVAAKGVNMQREDEELLLSKTPLHPKYRLSDEELALVNTSGGKSVRQCVSSL
jgi:hypothetical protein